LLPLAKSIELAMTDGATAAVRRACVDFLASTSEFYSVHTCGIRLLASRPLRVREHGSLRAFSERVQSYTDSQTLLGLTSTHSKVDNIPWSRPPNGISRYFPRRQCCTTPPKTDSFAAISFPQSSPSPPRAIFFAVGQQHRIGPFPKSAYRIQLEQDPGLPRGSAAH